MKYAFLTWLSVEECENKLSELMQSDNSKVFDLFRNDPKRIEGKVSRKNNIFWVRPPGHRKDVFAKQ